MNKELAAKWLASIIENGEPYDDLDDMEWSEFMGDAPGGYEGYHQAMLELVDNLIEVAGE